MLALDSTVKSLEVKLAGAAATTELPFVASYVAINQSTFALSAAAEVDGITTGGTAVTVIAAPGATTTRKLNYFSVVNVDTAAVALTVQVNNNATLRITYKVTLSVGDQLSFTDAGGWVIFDANGNRKTATGGVLPAANFPALSGDISTVAGSLVTTIGATKVTNAMLAGSISASKLIATDFTVITASGLITSNGGITGGAASHTTGAFSGLVTATITGGSAIAYPAFTALNAGSATHVGILAGGNAGFYGRVAGYDFYMCSNNNLYTRTMNGYASYYTQGAGAHSFWSQTSGNAGDAIGGTMYLSISNAGLVTIPTSNGLALTLTATTGTALLLDAGGLVRTLTSSKRYKEHLSPWIVSPETLDSFVRLSPKTWDYKGQKNGAAGFIAEDLDALGIVNAYGTSPLVNYKDGLAESNRDFALIGLQHLVIRRLWDRVSALEEKAA